MCGCRASWRSETLRSVQNQLDFHPPRLLSNAVQLTCNSVSRNQECGAAVYQASVASARGWAEDYLLQLRCDQSRV